MVPLIPQPPISSAGYINAALTVGDLWPPLNANGPADAVFWTDTELYYWIDEAAKKLARAGYFVTRDTSLTSATSTANYTLPATHVATIQCDLGARTLRPRNVHEVEAKDATWNASTGKPEAFLEDTQGFNRLTLYPAPTVTYNALTIGLVMQRTHPDVAVTAAIISAPQCIEEYFFFHALGEARCKETNASMDEIGAWFRGLTQQYEQVMAGLWTNGQ